MIIKLNTSIWSISFTRTKESRIYKKGQQVDNHFGKGGEEIHDVTHTRVFG